MARERFDHASIEKAAQEKWEALELYKIDLTNAKDPYYLLFEFPYPSGDLHIGHWYAFALTDIYARLLRMQGKDVLFPMGFDAFGLPAENAAMKYGKDPKAWTIQNMETMRAQVKTMGTSVDWSKGVVTCEPEYYQWTQWLFAKLVEAGLAERKEAPVKWCPKDQTVLANEQVVDGACERCGTPVEEKKLTQWFMKITQYADRLITDLEPLPWREDIKEAQRQWIGKSEGAHLYFKIAGGEEQITVFTTRADTVFGATYVVLAPEHPLVASLDIHNRDEVAAYLAQTKKKTERERSENKEKTGVELKGVRAINPATKEEIPVYVADYVLASYGTGAVMAVPAHDERDFEFSKKMGLPMRQVVVPCAPDPSNPPQEGFEEVKRDTVIVHLRDTVTNKYALLDWHGSLEGITTAIMGGIEEGQTPEEAALAEIKEEASLEGVRIVKQAPWITAAKYCASHKKQNRCAHAYAFLAEIDGVATQGAIDAKEQELHTLVWVDESEVLARLTPQHQKQVWQLLQHEEALTGDGYLMNSGEFDGRDNREAMWDIVAYVGGERTTNYRIRDWLVSRQRYWGCPIPMVYDPEGKPHYVGDENLPWLLPEDVDFTPTGEAPLASSKELKERVTRIFGEGWTPEYDTLDTFVDSSWYFYRYLAPHDGEKFSDPELLTKWIPVNRYSGGSEHTTMHLLYARFFHKALKDIGLVHGDEPFMERFNRGLILGPDGQKMSKSKGNVINPDEQVKKYGADAVRMYLAFIGPYTEPGSYPFSLEGVDAMRKFLDRVDRLSEKVKDGEASDESRRAVAKASIKITEDTTRFKLNTAISALMVLMNELEKESAVARTTYLDLVKLLAPYAPHLAEHLWERHHGEGSVHIASYPVADQSLLNESEVTIVVQINGKKRGEVKVAAEADENAVMEAVREVPAIANLLEGKQITRQVFVKGRLLNLVVA